MITFYDIESIFICSFFSYSAQSLLPCTNPSPMIHIQILHIFNKLSGPVLEFWTWRLSQVVKKERKREREKHKLFTL